MKKHLTTLLLMSFVSMAVGALTINTAAAAGPPKLIDIDTDKDDHLTPEEFKAATAAGVVIPFEKLDRKPKDGKISKKEYSVLMDEDCE